MLLQPDSGVFHFWVSLHLDVIHTLEMYILSLNLFTVVHERHFLEILCLQLLIHDVFYGRHILSCPSFDFPQKLINNQQKYD